MEERHKEGPLFVTGIVFIIVFTISAISGGLALTINLFIKDPFSDSFVLSSVVISALSGIAGTIILLCAQKKEHR